MSINFIWLLVLLCGRFWQRKLPLLNWRHERQLVSIQSLLNLPLPIKSASIILCMHTTISSDNNNLLGDAKFYITGFRMLFTLEAFPLVSSFARISLATRWNIGTRCKEWHDKQVEQTVREHVITIISSIAFRQCHTLTEWQKLSSRTVQSIAFYWLNQFGVSIEWASRSQRSRPAKLWRCEKNRFCIDCFDCIVCVL